MHYPAVGPGVGGALADTIRLQHSVGGLHVNKYSSVVPTRPGITCPAHCRCRGCFTAVIYDLSASMRAVKPLIAAIFIAAFANDACAQVPTIYLEETCR